MTDYPFTPFGNFDINKMMTDFNKMMTDVKVPGVDMQALLSLQRKNVEALTEANKRAVEGMQAVAKRQAEILAQAMTEAANAAQQVAGAGNPQEMGAKQAELTKQAFEKALADMRELSEMISKANTEAFAVINRRVTESIEELKALLAKP